MPVMERTMISFVDDFGYTTTPVEGDQEEADRRNALIEEQGLDDAGFWFVIPE